MIFLTLPNIPHSVLTMPPTVGPPVVIMHAVNFLLPQQTAVEAVAAHFDLCTCPHPSNKESPEDYERLHGNDWSDTYRLADLLKAKSDYEEEERYSQYVLDESIFPSKPICPMTAEEFQLNGPNARAYYDEQMIHQHCRPCQVSLSAMKNNPTPKSSESTAPKAWKLGRKIYKCLDPTCALTFVTQGKLSEHCLKIHGMRGFAQLSCRECRLEFVSEYTYQHHSLIHQKTRTFKRVCLKKCAGCKMPMENLSIYLEHLQNNNCYPRKDINYKCKNCSTVCSTLIDWVSHLLTHVKPRIPGPLGFEVCEICSKTFLARPSLSRHLRKIHNISSSNISDMLRYVCNICELTCANLSELLEHKNTHLNKKPVDTRVKCELCPRTLNKKSSLYTHIRNVHKIELPCQKTKLARYQRVN